MTKSDPPGLACHSACGAQDITPRRAQNNKLGINKLSPEVLSHIFLIGEKEERGSRKRSLAHSYISFQELASVSCPRLAIPTVLNLCHYLHPMIGQHVCSYWRNVAINTSALWTYIRITVPSSNRLAYLYISRVATTALFDVDIDLRSIWRGCIGSTLDHDDSLPSHAQECLGHISSIFRDLSTRGASINRWKSLQVYSRGAKVFLKLLRCLNLNPAPALRSLSFKSELTTHTWVENLHPSTTLYHRLSEVSTPNLRHVELTEMPWEILLNPSALLPFAGLTSLSLTAKSMLEEHWDPYNLLSVTPHLESLCINPPISYSPDDALDTRRICMSSLRSLSIAGKKFAYWSLHILKMVDAPVLERLTLSTWDKDNMNRDIAEYIATANASNGTPNKSIYPMLRELDVSRFNGCYNHDMMRMLQALPSVTHLSVRNYANLLGTPPWLLPNLEILTLPSRRQYYSRLGGDLQRRAEAGFWVKVVKITEDWILGAKYLWGLPDFVQLQVLAAPRNHRVRPVDCACNGSCDGSCGCTSGDETSEEEDSGEEGISDDENTNDEDSGSEVAN